MQDKLGIIVTIVDYGMGNLRSVFNKLESMVTDARLSSEAEDILSADALILPGVGHFKKGMENLHSLGLISVLEKKVIQEKTPILGICLGMQLFSLYSEEGEVEGLGWIKAKTIKFDVSKVQNPYFKIPHMGWNTLKYKGSDSLTQRELSEEEVYFCHSYHLDCDEEQDILSTCSYGYEFTSSVRKGNITGMQFHPEKSHDIGYRLLQDFLTVAVQEVRS